MSAYEYSSGIERQEYDIAAAIGSQPVEYRRVYVWELPVRVYHWINAVALVVLCVTGYLIGTPICAVFMRRRLTSSIGSVGCGSSTLPARLSMCSTFAARLYWGFVGNKYSQLEHLSSR